MDDNYQPRLLDCFLDDAMSELSAALITGPRATGKTTTAARLARTIIRLDRPNEAAVARSDPDAMLRGQPRPVLIDEWQVVPSILGAVKRAVDEDPSPGQFLVTGSVRAELDTELWPGTGRLVRVHLSGLSTRERTGGIDAPGLIERIVEHGPDAIENPSDPPDLRGYVQEILVPGFPYPALRLQAPRRRHWLSSYLDQILTHDADDIDHGRDPVRLGRYLEAVALNTAGVVDEVTLYTAAGINRKTALAYDKLLGALSIIESLPAWWTNRLKRLVLRPKRFITDAALAATAMRLDETAIMRDGDALGRLIETYVVAQLRSDLATTCGEIRLYHLRTEQGRHEVDLVAEVPGHRVIGMEVKASSAPNKDDIRHLQWLRDELGERFMTGLLFHTGSRVFRLDQQIFAVPIASMWNQGQRGGVG